MLTNFQFSKMKINKIIKTVVHTDVKQTTDTGDLYTWYIKTNKGIVLLKGTW